MINLAFRVDGGASIGMGHVMRCLALASFLPDNVKTSFITVKNPIVNYLIKNNGYKVINLPGLISLDEELVKVKNIIDHYSIDIVITDSYKINNVYLSRLKEVVERLVSIHDFAPHPFSSDIVINGNIYGSKLNYISSTGESKFLLGTKYTIMRKEFYNLPIKKIDRDVKRVLITVGGGDSLNLTPKILTAIRGLQEFMTKENREIYYKNIHFDIVIGPAFENIGLIVEKIEDICLQVSLHFNIKQISNLMVKSDLAISAGGSTLCELSAVGIPTISLLQAQNQILAAEWMERQGIIENLGFGDNVLVGEITDRLVSLIENYNLRIKMSRKGQELFDGFGAERCVEEILSF